MIGFHREFAFVDALHIDTLLVQIEQLLTFLHRLWFQVARLPFRPVKLMGSEKQNSS